VQGRGISAATARERGRELLARVGLAERVNYYPKELSGGQKQRVAIARALAMEPRGLLCDEITSALDPELKAEVLDVLMDLKAEGMTLIVVTHEIHFARRAADRVLLLADGRIAEDGTPGKVFEAPETDRARRFLKTVMA
jgi:ABC-type polar amino acid transport system ATPase subunit